MTEAQKRALEARVRELLARGDSQRALEVSLYGEGQRLPGYHEELYHYLLKECGDEADEVFGVFSQNLCGGITSFRGESTFRTWAYTILKNTLLKYRESQAKKNFAPVRIRPASGVSSLSGPASGPKSSISESKIKADEASPSTLFRKEEEKEKLRRLIQKLGKSDRQLMDLVLERGMSYEEIALELSELLGKKVKPETIRQRYHRAQERLKKLAEAAGYV